MPYVKPIDEERVKRGTCNRCGSPVLRARVGRVMALDVTVDPIHLHDDRLALGRLLWCWTGKRLLWRDHRNCEHDTYADHQCRGDDVSDDDPFGTDTRKKLSSPYSGMHHPVTGRLIGRHVRVTNFIKGLLDEYGLVQWQMRMVAQGLAASDDLLREIRDNPNLKSIDLDGICSRAKRAAGGEDASNWGTHVHKQTEYADLGAVEKLDRDPAIWSRVREYRQELLACEITIIPELIERKICHTGLSSLITGTFDRIVRLSDGTYTVLDVKTGSLDTEKYLEKWLSIAAQLEIYRQAAAQHGVWDPQTKTWQPAPTLRDDFALVAHLPAKGLGCHLYEVPLEDGRHALGVLDALRTFRRRKPQIDEYTPRTMVDVKALSNGATFRKRSEELPFLIDTAVTVANLMKLVGDAKTLGIWNQQLSDAARLRHKQITERA